MGRKQTELLRRRQIRITTDSRHQLRDIQSNWTAIKADFKKGHPSVYFPSFSEMSSSFFSEIKNLSSNMRTCEEVERKGLKGN